MEDLKDLLFKIIKQYFDNQLNMLNILDAQARRIERLEQKTFEVGLDKEGEGFIVEED